MSRINKTILSIPETVKEDVLGYRAKLAEYLAGNVKPVAFKAYRVPMGIYQQREEGRFMVRIRIGAGLVWPYQLDRIARLSRKYGNGTVHITTRQDIQIHEVKIEDTADVLEQLLEAGLSARGGGGNTVRNVSACAGAGICAEEAFDVAPHSIATAEYLLQERSSFNLPRKYKIAFSGCKTDCALASMTDLGFFAKIKNGKQGFSVYAAGGLGGSPSAGVKIEDFVEDNEIFYIAEAVKQLFDKYGDRSNKHKARLRYVLARVGEEEFVKMYKDRFKQVKESGLAGNVPQIKPVWQGYLQTFEKKETIEPAGNILPEKTEGRYAVRLRLSKGDVTADGLSVIADAAEKLGEGPVRTSQQQDLYICGLTADKIAGLTELMKPLGIDVDRHTGPKVVVCTGAATCKLGLCMSRGLGDAISEKLENLDFNNDDAFSNIRISGCPNSCGHHLAASIGFQGRAKRIEGKLMPCYDVMAGAVVREGRAKLAEKIGTVPAKRIPEMVEEIYKKKAASGDRLNDIVASYSDFSGDFPEDYYCDYGRKEPFSLAGRGPGECGAGVMDVIRVDIDQAKSAGRTACNTDNPREKNQAVANALSAAARALLVIFGKEPKKDRQVFADFQECIINPGWVKPDSRRLLDAVVDWRLGDRENISDLSCSAWELVERVEKLFLSLDANLKFTLGKIADVDGGQSEQTSAADDSVDLRGVACPLNFVKAKLALERVQTGQVLEIMLDEGESIKNVPESFTGQGHQVLNIDKRQGYYLLSVRRVK